MVGPLGGDGARDPRTPTINAKKRERHALWEVAELEIWKSPPSMLGNVNGGGPWQVLTETREGLPSTLKTSTVGPLGGARAGDPGEPIINAKKHRWWPPGRCRS
jgi:hypothetical protein